jgi:hypothetical protein
MLSYIFILYGAFSLLFILMMGLFSARIGKRFPLPGRLSEKMASERVLLERPEVFEPKSQLSSEMVNVASRIPALSFSHSPAKGL